MNNGWIKIHRKLLDNPISQKPHYAWLWVYLLMICNHENQEFIWNGEKKTVKRGQIITGRINLSQNTGIPASTVEDILRYFENDGQIRQQKTNKFRLITVNNYNQYQDVPTTSRQQADNKPTQTRMNKNDKKEIIKTSPLLLEAFKNVTGIKTPDGDYQKDNLFQGRYIAKKIREQLELNGEKDIKDERIIQAFSHIISNMDEFHKKNATNLAYINRHFNKIINTLK